MCVRRSAHDAQLRSQYDRDNVNDNTANRHDLSDSYNAPKQIGHVAFRKELGEGQTETAGQFTEMQA